MINTMEKLAVASLIKKSTDEVNDLIKNIENQSSNTSLLIDIKIIRHTKENTLDNPVLREKKRLARKIKEAIDIYKCRLENLTELLFSNSEEEIEETLGKNSGKYKY